MLLTAQDQINATVSAASESVYPGYLEANHENQCIIRRDVISLLIANLNASLSQRLFFHIILSMKGLSCILCSSIQDWAYTAPLKDPLEKAAKGSNDDTWNNTGNNIPINPTQQYCKIVTIISNINKRIFILYKYHTNMQKKIQDFCIYTKNIYI